MEPSIFASGKTIIGDLPEKKSKKLNKIKRKRKRN